MQRIMSVSLEQTNQRGRQQIRHTNRAIIVTRCITTIQQEAEILDTCMHTLIAIVCMHFADNSSYDGVNIFLVHVSCVATFVHPFSSSRRSIACMHTLLLLVFSLICCLRGGAAVKFVMTAG